jgi:anti-sigma factor RsiW
MVDCANRVRLDAYHDRELSPAERSGVEAHLRDCPSCAAELAAMRGMSRAFADTAPREPSHERLLQLARSVRAEPTDARMLLGLFRGTAVAAAVLLACALAGGVYLSRRTEAAAREAMVLDRVAAGSQPVALAADRAQWIADDLLGRQEER